MFKPHQVTESEVKEMTLDSYVTYIHNHQCTNCGSVETFSQCFEVWLHPTKTRSTNLRDQRIVVGELKPLNMAVIKVPARTIPICASCVSRYRVIGPPETVAMVTNVGAWQETLRRKYAEPEKPTKPAAPTKIVPTLDQI